MSRWDIFRWRTLAGGPPCRQGRQRFSHQAFLSPRPKRVPPFGISDGGGHGCVRGAGGLPSPPSFGGHLPQRGRRDLAFCKPLVSRLLGSPFGGAGTAAAVTERASCQPHRPLPWLSPLRARPPRSLVSFWLRAHKVKGKVEAFLKKSFTKKL